MSEESNSIEMVENNGLTTEIEQQRRTELQANIAQSYYHRDGRYHSVLNPVTETITDHGNRLTTSSNSIETASVMSNIADSRGWSSVRISGSDAFYETSSDHFAWGTQVQVDRTMTAEAKQVQDGIDISNKAAELKQERESKGTIKFTEIEADQPDNIVQRKGTQSAKFMGTSEREDWEARQLAARKRIEEQYRVAGKKGELFYKKDQRGMREVLAFKVTARGAKTSLNDERVIASMIEYEREVKGATKLHLTGHKDFRRAAWREASQRGMETTGYKPTEIELQRMSAKQLGGDVVRTHVQGAENQRLVNEAIAERVDQQIPERQQQLENQEELSL